MAGGRGSIIGTIPRRAVIGVVNNGIVLLNIEFFWQDVIGGTLPIFAVAIDQPRLRLTRDARSPRLERVDRRGDLAEREVGFRDERRHAG